MQYNAQLIMQMSWGETNLLAVNLKSRYFKQITKVNVVIGMHQLALPALL